MKISRVEKAWETHKRRLSPDCPEMTENAWGGKSTPNDLDYSLLPTQAIEMVGLLMTEATTRYERDNWRYIGALEHINHVLRHVFAYLRTGDKDDLASAACRALMALEMATTHECGNDDGNE